MSSLKFPHASGNSMSIAAPATNPASDLELKLPATIGTANQYLKNSSTAGTLEFATLASSKILQIKTLVSDGYQLNPADWTTVFSQALTPTSSTSKIIVLVSTFLGVGATSEIQLALYDGTIRKGYREHRNYDSVNERSPVTVVWVAEGSYTAGTAYTFSFQAKRSGGSSNCEIGNSSTDWRSSMVVLEVDAS